MAKDATRAFEVATIKPSDPSDHSRGFHTMGHRIFIENEDVNTLIMFAYSADKSQIIGAPAWFGTERFDINGVPDAEGQPNLKQEQGMVQKLLVDRFGLKFNPEQRELAVYALGVAKGGPKLEKSKSDPNALLDQTGNGNHGQQDWRFTNNSMNDFAGLLQSFLEKPVVNRTGLQGKYDFFLKWTSSDAPQIDPGAPPVLFTALREQLGLDVEPTKAPVDVLVVTHVERPTAN